MYHLRDGFRFSRNEDGAIVLEHGIQPMRTTVAVSEFASVVAHLSRRGETGETFAAAMGLLESQPAGQAVGMAFDGADEEAASPQPDEPRWFDACPRGQSMFGGSSGAHDFRPLDLKGTDVLALCVHCGATRPQP